MKEFPNLFTPITIRGVTFKNRICMAPQKSSGPAKDGYIVTRGMSYFEERARGGFGMVCLGETFVDHNRDFDSLDLWPQYYGMDLHDRTSLSHLSRSIKRHGAVASAELNHGGAFTLPIHLKPGELPLAPSVIKTPYGHSSKEMTEGDMEKICEKFSDCARYFKEMGFDMIFIHGGHSWLIGQFLSPLWNHRSDRYGGSLENRARFPVMLLEGIRKKCGENFPIELRVSGSEELQGGIELPETIEFCKMIEDKVDIIHVSVGSTTDHGGRMFSSYYEPNALNAANAAQIRKAVKIPVSVVGGINDAYMAEKIIAEGMADFVALGRQALADPEFGKKAVEGRPKEIAPCIRCMSCHSAPPPPAFACCTVNPRATFEADLCNIPLHASKPKKVFVAGGGPCGMKFAVTAAERGHQVTLFEKSARLGGAINFTDYDAFKNDINKFKNHLVYMTGISGIKILLNTELTPEIIEKEAPDTVIAAIGASPVVPEIPGLLENGAMKAADAIGNSDKVGKKVAIIGGGLTGLETGLHFAAQGKTVTVIEMTAETMRDAFMATKGWVSHKIKQLPNITVLTSTVCREITGKGILIEKDGESRVIEADTVIYSAGMKSNSSEHLRNAAPCRFEVLGDARKPGKVTDAIHDAYYIALDL